MLIRLQNLKQYGEKDTPPCEAFTAILPVGDFLIHLELVGLNPFLENLEIYSRSMNSCFLCFVLRNGQHKHESWIWKHSYHAQHKTHSN